MYITILEVRQLVFARNGKNRCSRSESGILQPASRTGHGICQTFEPIPEVFGRMSVSFP